MNKKVLMKRDKNQNVKTDTHIQYTNIGKHNIVNTIYLNMWNCITVKGVIMVSKKEIINANKSLRERISEQQSTLLGLGEKNAKHVAKIKDLGGKVYVMAVSMGDLMHYHKKNIVKATTRQREFEKAMQFLKVDDFI